MQNYALGQSKIQILLSEYDLELSEKQSLHQKISDQSLHQSTLQYGGWLKNEVRFIYFNFFKNPVKIFVLK